MYSTVECNWMWTIGTIRVDRSINTVSLSQARVQLKLFTSTDYFGNWNLNSNILLKAFQFSQRIYVIKAENKGLKTRTSFLKNDNHYPEQSLIHLGLAMNACKSQFTDHYLSSSFFPNLKSLDLSSNQLTNLNTFIKSTQSLKHLGAVNLSNNPLCNYKYYKAALIDKLHLSEGLKFLNNFYVLL